MPKKVDISRFIARDFLKCTLTGEKAVAVVLDRTKGGMLLTGGAFSDFAKYRGLYFDIRADCAHNGRFEMAFWRKEKDPDRAAPDVTAVFGVLPGVMTRIFFDFGWLDGQGVHMPRTPGRLKMGISASARFTISEMGSFRLSTIDSPTAYGFSIENFTLSESVPDFPYERRKLLDELGQWLPGDWKGKTHGEAELKAKLAARLSEAEGADALAAWPERDKWGGWTKLKLTEGTGFFATHHDKRRWWLVDPDGYAFISAGPDCVGTNDAWMHPEFVAQALTWLPDKGDPAFKDAWRERMGEAFNYEIANLIRAFGDDWKEQYIKIARHDLLRWGMNTIANWSDLEVCRKAKIPYFIPMPGYPTTHPTVFRSFPDVFSPEFEQNAKEYARHLEQFKDDPYLIAYFMTNEPDWAYIHDLNVAEQTLACPFNLHSKDALIGWLKDQYESVGKFNDAWNLRLSSFEDLKEPIREARNLSEKSREDLNAFSRIMVRRYTEVPALCCREVDHQHLNAGMRYAFISSEDLLEGWDLFDIYSINSYRMSPVEDVNRIAGIIDRPVLIGEFHFGALDAGLPATGLRGVTSQEERGFAYAYYVENAVAHKSVVGAHYFVYDDQSAMGRFDGENLNIGCVDVCMMPYQGLAAGIRSACENLYPVAAGKKMPTRRAAKEIPMVFA